MGTGSKPSLPEQQDSVAPGTEERLRHSYLGLLVGMRIGSPLRRRLGFAVVVVISQLLLIALAIAWLIFMVIIAVNGSVYFVERNLFVRWLEVAAVVLIILFATGVFITQLKRLGERRRDDDRRSGGRG